jgi:hypothetical protein
MPVVTTKAMTISLELAHVNAAAPLTAIATFEEFYLGTAQFVDGGGIGSLWN